MMKKVKVRITEYDLELSRSGVNPGDIVEGTYDPTNGSVHFAGKGRFVEPCVAWIGVNCKLIKKNPCG